MNVAGGGRVVSRLAGIGLLCAGMTLGFVGSMRADNPFQPRIRKSRTVADLVDFARIPDVDGRAPRVSQLDASPSGELYVVDQLGPMYFVSADGGTVTSYLDLRDVPGFQLRTNSEAGFQSAAFHPDFLKQGAPGYGKFYTIASSGSDFRAADFEPRSGDAFDTVLTEWTCADPTARPFAAADGDEPFREVLRIRQPYGNHNAGLIAFHSNASPGDRDYGMLYAGIADGGAGGDPQKLAQDLGRVFGKILRIDPLGRDSANGRYGIPGDNPFVGAAGALPEIWAYGLRNPQRFRWDRGGKKRMFISDIGQNAVEEINVGFAGANYGWSEREGDFQFVDGAKIGANRRADGTESGFVYPIAEYGHEGASATTTGTVYRGGGLPELNGKLVFGDIPKGIVYFIDADFALTSGTAPITRLRVGRDGVETTFLDVIKSENAGAPRADLRFGSDSRGNVYVLNKSDGVIRRLTAPPTPVARIP